MSKAFIDDTNLTNIANAIRTKLGVVDTYLPSEMAGAILSIPKRKVVDFNVSPITLNSALANSLQYVKAYGKCEQNGTPTPTSPVDIVCNNGVLKIYKNLFDATDPTTTINAFVGSSSVGSLASINSSTNDRSFIIKTKPNTKYTIQKLGGGAPYNRFRISESGVFPQIGQQSTKLYEDSATTSGLRTATVTTGNSGNYIIVYGLNGSPGTELPTFLDNFVVCEGNTINVGQIYTDGLVETIEDSLNNTATVKMLLKVGNYQDVQSIIDGVVTRNVGIKVLDGTEDWVAYNGGVYFPLGGGGSLPLATVAYCSHFSYAGGNVLVANLPMGDFTIATNGNCSFKSSDTATKADWVAWLAQQYAAGTPVIIVYQLATPTTESVAGQTLQVQAGDNTLEITQSALSGLEVECEYFLQ